MASRERAIVNNLNERARFYGQSEMLTVDDVRVVLVFYNHVCLACGEKPAASVDHVKPLARGGANRIENLQLLCVKCNKVKHDEEKDYRAGRICARTRYKKHNWDEIRFEYVTSTELPSLQDLAQKYNVAESHVASVASREHWSKDREKFRSELGVSIQQEAAREQIDFQLEITRTTLDFLKLWRQQNNKISNQDLIKILELGARAYGLELDKRTLTVKDWRDAAGEDVSSIHEYASNAAETYYSGGDNGSDRDPGAGWTD